MVNDSLVDDGSTVTYDVMGLLPVTMYSVWVTTHNGVSDQDPQNDHLRRCEASAETTEGGNYNGLLKTST